VVSPLLHDAFGGSASRLQHPPSQLQHAMNINCRSLLLGTPENSAGFGTLLFLLTIDIAIWFIVHFTFLPALFLARVELNLPTGRQL
jgi:hypothetical protein